MTDYSTDPQAQQPAPPSGPAPVEKKERKDYEEMLTKIEDRLKILEDKFMKGGKEAWKQYLGDADNIPFNILYSNTEIIVPATFSQKPIPRVTRRFDAQRADGVAEVANRMLSFCMDTNIPSYPSFMTAVEDSVLDAAVAGQGIARVRLVDQVAVLDYVEWTKYVWGYCPRWEAKPWEAFAHDMEPDEILEQFKDTMSPEDKTYFQTKSKELLDESEPEKDQPKGTCVRVWEMWDKATKEVHYLCKAARLCCLSSEPDPLKLNGFFPTPKPLTLLHSTTDTLPRPLYRLYESQAQELNEITRRLKKITRAIKVRGLYASGIDDIAKVLKEDDDNVLVPSTAAAQIVSTGKGLDAYIWMIPIDKLVIVAKELYAAREAVKGTIYEIMGIGDILRGVSKASETLGAQQLKDKWGSLRINKARERVAEYIRDLLRLLLEVSAKHTPEALWGAITAVDLMPSQQFQIAQNMAQQTPPPVPQVPGQPPQPPVPPPQPPDPMTSWFGVLGALKNDLRRAYIVDIETNSSVDSEATQEKQDMAEFMNAFGQAMAGLQQLFASGPSGWKAGITILTKICSKFNLGSEIEPLLRNLQPPQQGANPDQLKQLQAQLAQKEKELQGREQSVMADEQASQQAVSQVSQASKDLQHQHDALKATMKEMLKEIDFAVREAKLELVQETMQHQMKGMQIDQKNQQSAAIADDASQAATQAGQTLVQEHQNAVKDLGHAATEHSLAVQGASQKLDGVAAKAKLATQAAAKAKGKK